MMFQRALLVLTFLLLTGCMTNSPSDLLSSFSDNPAEVYFVKNETPLYETPSSTKELSTLSIGNQIDVLEVVDGMARTDAGWVALKDIEKERSLFQLTVQAPANATVKILNIEPKYRDGIWLTKGKYHIGVYQAGKPAITRWITLDEDRVLTMDGSNAPKRVQLTVNAPAGSTVKIQNIKPKYHDKIELNAGRYHLVVYQNNQKIYDEWKNIVEDTTVDIAGIAPASAAPNTQQATAAPSPVSKSGRTKPASLQANTTAPAPPPSVPETSAVPEASAVPEVPAVPEAPAKQPQLSPVEKALKEITLMPLPKQARPWYK